MIHTHFSAPLNPLWAQLWQANFCPVCGGRALSFHLSWYLNQMFKSVSLSFQSYLEIMPHNTYCTSPDPMLAKEIFQKRFHCLQGGGGKNPLLSILWNMQREGNKLPLHVRYVKINAWWKILLSCFQEISWVLVIKKKETMKMQFAIFYCLSNTIIHVLFYFDSLFNSEKWN